MVNITLVEFHLEDASFAPSLPFGSSESEPADATVPADADASDTTEDDGTADGGDGIPTKPAAVAVGLLFLIVLGALVKYRLGEDPEVDIETPDTPDAPVGVTVSDGE